MCKIIFDEFSILIEILFVGDVSEILTSGNDKKLFISERRKLSTHGGACEYPFICYDCAVIYGLIDCPIVI